MYQQCHHERFAEIANVDPRNLPPYTFSSLPFLLGSCQLPDVHRLFTKSKHTASTSHHSEHPLQAGSDCTSPDPIFRRLHCVHRVVARSRQTFPSGDIWTCILAQCEGTKPSICPTVSFLVFGNITVISGRRHKETYHHRIHRRH